MADCEAQIELIKKYINSYPDWPKTGVLFRDIFSVLQKPDVFQVLADVLIETAKNIEPPVECIAALDARGFLFGPLVSLHLKVPFVPIRKKFKLPGCVISIEYEKEYGKDVVEIQAGSIEPGKRVLIVDDLLATGGSLAGACELIKKVGGQVAACLVVIELENLKGRQKVSSDVISLIKY